MDLDRTPPTQGLTQENPQLQPCSEPLKQPGEVHAGGGGVPALVLAGARQKKSWILGVGPFPSGDDTGQGGTKHPRCR